MLLMEVELREGGQTGRDCRLPNELLNPEGAETLLNAMFEGGQITCGPGDCLLLPALLNPEGAEMLLNAV